MFPVLGRGYIFEDVEYQSDVSKLLKSVRSWQPLINPL